MNKEIVADLCDMLSFVMIGLLDLGDILEYVYMILFIFSLALGIVLKVYTALQDHKITKEEIQDIKKSVDDAKDDIHHEIDNSKGGK